MFLKSRKRPAEGKYNELTRTPDHLSLTHAPEEDPKWAQNFPLHAYEVASRSGVSQKIPIIFIVKFLHIFSSAHNQDSNSDSAADVLEFKREIITI